MIPPLPAGEESTIIPLLSQLSDSLITSHLSLLNFLTFTSLVEKVSMHLLPRLFKMLGCIRGEGESLIGLMEIGMREKTT